MFVSLSVTLPNYEYLYTYSFMNSGLFFRLLFENESKINDKSLLSKELVILLQIYARPFFIREDQAQ